MAVPSIRLSSGYKMPVLGLGTLEFGTEGDMEAVIETALECGYRHIDAAFVYNNEEAVGRALKKWMDKGGKRRDLFITSKLPVYANKPSGVEKFIRLSLKNLQLDYLDMYLIHMPFSILQEPGEYALALEPDGTVKLELNTSLVSVWKEMEKQVRNGNTRSIGLSNYSEKQITEVWESADIKPSNVQVELHAYFQQKSLRHLCKRYDMAVTAHSSLAAPGAKPFFEKYYNWNTDKFPDLIGHPVVQKIATSHGKSTAQILLRHSIQNEIIVIPKSGKPERIKENIQLFDFELTEEEMDLMDDLDRGHKGRIYDFSFFKGIEKHPDYPLKEELELE